MDLTKVRVAVNSRGETGVYYVGVGLIFSPRWFKKPATLLDVTSEHGDLSKCAGHLLPKRIRDLPLPLHLFWWIATDVFENDDFFFPPKWTYISWEEFDAWLKDMGFTGKDSTGARLRWSLY